MLKIHRFKCICCNSDKLNFVAGTDSVSCESCNKSYRFIDNKIVFYKLDQSEVSDNLDKLKSRLKQFSAFYYFLIETISPVYSSLKIKDFIAAYPENESVVLNIGSGNSRLSNNVINVDIFEYENVDVVCDIANLPFIDNSIDAILNIAVLEHVSNPRKVIDEMYRVLKPGGTIYTAFPFIQGFHASPYDFTRVTEEGIKELHSGFDMLEVRPFGGPTSGLLWVLQEWIAILLSFGSKKLHTFIYLSIMVLTFPLKFLDYFLIRHPMAKNISSGFVYIGRKNETYRKEA